MEWCWVLQRKVFCHFQNNPEYLSLKYFSSKNVPINYLASKSFTLLMEHRYIEGEICKWQKENSITIRFTAEHSNTKHQCKDLSFVAYQISKSQAAQPIKNSLRCYSNVLDLNSFLCYNILLKQIHFFPCGYILKWNILLLYKWKWHWNSFKCNINTLALSL